MASSPKRLRSEEQVLGKAKKAKAVKITEALQRGKIATNSAIISLCRLTIKTSGIHRDRLEQH